MDAEQDAARAWSARMKKRYDQAVYTPQPEPMLDLETVLGLARLYGCGGTEAPDVLDLGCGVGVQLERAARQTKGRVTGTDISGVACRQAADRVKDHGERASVIASDILDLTPEKLGSFDVVYCVGVLYVAPPPVRRRIVRLIAACMKPGGVAVISYYAGAMGLLRAELNRMIRQAAGEGSERERLGRARRFLDQVASQFQRGDPGLPAQTAGLTAAYTDEQTLLHECLCEEMTALHTTALAASLEGEGVRFFSYLHGLPAAAAASAEARAEGADVFDYAYGGYRYALFGRPEGDGPPDAARAQGWRTPLARQAGPAGYRGPAAYRAGNGGQITINSPWVQAALDEMGRDGAARAGLAERAARRLAQAGWETPAGGATALDVELSKLWLAGGVFPLWLGGPR